MTTYAIGDVQGCYDALMQLLDTIHFDSSRDELWFTGDLVNRGPRSLETLRFVKQLGDTCKVVLGNHDLHLLARLHDAHPGWAEDTLDAVLKAPDRDELTEWLCQKPLLHHDDLLHFTMVHAGLSPDWDLEKAASLAKEVETVLQSPMRIEFLSTMYGNFPNQWDPTLKGFDRLRCITNYFTRARLCDEKGALDLENTDPPTNEGPLMPWFKVPHRKNAELNIIFGHWAALGGVTHTARVYALDTGCVWGHQLTAMRLQDQKRICVDCK